MTPSAEDACGNPADAPAKTTEPKHMQKAAAADGGRDQIWATAYPGGRAGISQRDDGPQGRGRVGGQPGAFGMGSQPGGGRKKAVDRDPGLRPALLKLVEPEERVFRSLLRWTVKSTRNARPASRPDSTWTPAGR